MEPINQQHKKTRVRFAILALVFVNVVINYMDRSNISVAAAGLGKDLHLSSVQLGLIFSAFGWTYACLQIPGGVLVDRFGPRLVYTFSLIAWSVSTLFQGLIKGFATLFALRLVTGAFEAPAYPTNNRIVTSWFPEQERASAIALYTSGQFVGLAFLTPALAAIQYYLSWRGLFIVTGAIGILWGVIWYVIYRDPLEHKRVNRAELDHIEKGGGTLTQQKSTGNGFQWSQLKQLFTYRKLWGIYIGQFSVNSVLWFFLTWFPTYLVEYRGMDFLRSGLLASIPFLAACAGLLMSGFLSDHLIRKGRSAGLARKLPVIVGLALSSSIVFANYVHSPALIIFFMAIAFFGNGMATISWIFVSILSPKHLVGLTGGVFNFIGNLAAIVVPAVIGFLASGGNFQPALIFVGLLAFTGACSYIFLVGKVERVGTPEKQ